MLYFSRNEHEVEHVLFKSLQKFSKSYAIRRTKMLKIKQHNFAQCMFFWHNKTLFTAHRFVVTFVTGPSYLACFTQTKD